MGRQSSASRRLEEDCLEFGNKLTIEHQVRLIRSFNKKDVKEALFGIHSSKSPGPDGFGATFLKELWNDIGDDFSCAVLGFFPSGKLPQEVSATSISLIPKIDNPQGASDYRPIACCTTTYKCISKMICTRLSEVLPELIHENQGAFVKKRLLAHNVLILQDLLKGYTRKNISSRCIMKIDLSKAYDTVDWCFVADILKALCFPSKFITWILSCLQGASYALLLNGRIQVKIVKEAFQRFSEATGLIANKAKSTVFFGGIPISCKQRLANILQMEEGSFPLKYLGVYLRPTKWRSADCGIILDKLHKNLHTWASRNLSFARRAQLIHSILLGIRNYWMGLFLLPRNIMAAIDKCCSDFLWGSKGNRSKFHIPSWEKVCLPKNSGGLGFREGKIWNIALMAKYI
uniref:Reverse transcriptase domain-containing protein n=1 Tax=Cannabis sativa TaxID=3483 RepID=A0A803PSI7_CANSA